MKKVFEQKTMQLAHELASQKESVIKAAIKHHIGKNWTDTDITGRGEFTVLPDGTEIFSFDGCELIHFYHTKVEMNDLLDGTSMRAVTAYRLLY